VEAPAVKLAAAMEGERTSHTVPTHTTAESTTAESAAHTVCTRSTSMRGHSTSMRGHSTSVRAHSTTAPAHTTTVSGHTTTVPAHTTCGGSGANQKKSPDFGTGLRLTS
jgi:hypothetical protein